jgi:signal transduction histidine kinase/CheY-like chemotaxis protein/HPt (histidine-containing phosphotransfer) domain-containing protein
LSRLSDLLAPEGATEERIRRLELLGLLNGGFFLLGLAVFVLSFPLHPTPLRVAALGVLAACTGGGLWLRRHFWTALDRELLRRKQAEQEARAADRAKGQLLSHVSHEIRTPMNGVLGMAELLLAGELTTVQREQVQVIRTSSEALLALVNDLLDLSRVEAGRLLLRPRDFSFQELAGDVLRLLAPQAAERGVELRLRVDPALPDALYGDPVRLRQVLLNLVGNGIRFTRKGSVTVTAEPLERETPAFRCEVSDTGVGIRPEVQERLFQPFAQAQSSASHGFGGTGLGLVICKNIVELMGGEMGFHSTRGVGSTFWFRVPLVPARGSTPPSAAAAGDAEARRLARQERRILVVDDRSANRSVALALLRKLGYTADAVEGGEEALAFLAAKHCAAVLLDLEMVGLDGFETCRRLRRQEKVGGSAARIPVIALSAHTSEKERAKCFAVGMDGFLPKPFRTGELAAALDLWTGVEAPAALPPAAEEDKSEEEPEPAAESLDERLAALKSLEDKTGGSILAEVVKAFLHQGETDLAAMQRALPQGDGKTVSAAAHALAGSSAVLGATNLARCAGELARLARQGEMVACAPRLAEVEEEFRVIAQRLAP